MRNPVLEVLKKGKVSLGSWLNLGSPLVVMGTTKRARVLAMVLEKGVDFSLEKCRKIV